MGLNLMPGQTPEKRSPVRILSEAMENGSLLSLQHQPTCWPGVELSVEIPANNRAGRKAAASCRTLKLRKPAPALQSGCQCPIGRHVRTRK
jgi:hypothetical protein